MNQKDLFLGGLLYDQGNELIVDLMKISGNTVVVTAPA
jgi:hypothetical protein